MVFGSSSKNICSLLYGFERSAGAIRALAPKQELTSTKCASDAIEQHRG